MRFAFVVIAALCLTAHAVSAKTQVCPRHGAGHKTSRTPTGVADGSGGSYVTNGIVRLGVSKYGTLNVRVPQWDAESYSDINYDGTVVGLQYTGYQIGGKFPDATAPGCYCEGWGLSAKDTDNNFAEGAHSANDGVLGGLTAVSHDSPNALEVISHTQISGPNNVTVLVEHHFRPSPKTPNLYEVNVTVTNVGALAIKELKYVRTMDWDVPPTSFDDCLDINMGSAGDEGGDIECVHSNGQTVPLPTQFVGEVGDAIIRLGRCFDPAVTNKSVEKAGPYDSGSAWLFNFHEITEATPLVVGESRNWLVYYGAADNDVQANQVLAAASIEAYTYGYPNKNDACPRDGVRFIFGFGKVGGDIIIPNCVDDPNCIIRNVQATCSSSHASVSTETGTCVSLNFGGSESCNP